MKKVVIGILILAVFLSGACARLEPPVPSASLVLDKPAPLGTRDKQEKRSFEIFEQILATVQESSNDESFAKVEQLYLELIITCPDVGLAQEGAWRLFTKYYERNTPESLSKARDLHDYVARLYPQSVFREMMKRKMAGAETVSQKK